MQYRFIIVLLVLLAILQVLLLGRGDKADIRMLQAGISNLESSSRQMTLTQEKLKRELEHYRQVIANIPASVLMGFADPEAVFAGFLDFLHAQALAAVGAQVVMRRQLQFVKTPVPLRASDFSFRFNFSTVAEADFFLDYLLMQKTYPLRVERLHLNSSPGQGRVAGELSVSLMIPDKLLLVQPRAGE
ncbi:MAG: hypothetical protein JXR80_09350 [Deltaproteobacteria bacterium]|nr:hypothetical protein [Deltaproteobacteria bacterium]